MDKINKPTQEEIDEKIRLHSIWLKDHRLGKRAYFLFEDLRNKEFNSLNLQEADFSDSILVDTDFSNSNLRSANFSNTFLTRADFSMANLEGADFIGAKMFGANLFEAKLSGVVFSKAIFSETNLSKADLVNCRLEGVFVDSTKTRETNIGYNCEEHWNILKRNYSGFLTIVILTTSFFSFAPYLLEALLLKYSHDPLQRNEETTLILEYLLGFNDKNPLFTVTSSIILIIYNTGRGWVTWRVSGLRDQESQTFISPPLSNYIICHYLHHYFLKWIFYFSLASLVWKIWSLLLTRIPI